ncbi:MAG: twin-arginine translocation signal domain-containing protein, partial [Actinobacteria bacterium]|nr:twin-arginine translocation signal domain-containing protein [Actinomycetota bacterium]
MPAERTGRTFFVDTEDPHTEARPSEVSPRLDRRRFLRLTAGAVGAGVFATQFPASPALAQPFT